jgi:microcystin degradation protein MlrC
MRIAFARIAQESNALSPVATTFEDFAGSHLVEGVALLENCRRRREVPGIYRRVELGGFVRAADRLGVEAVPVMSAWSAPAGPLTAACFDALRDRLAEGIKRVGPVDGVFLALHGAMCVEGRRDGESELLRVAREAAGGVPIATTHDLHGNMTQARFDAADLIVAYGTNPHRDHARVGDLAGTLLIRTLRREIAPVGAWRSLPILLGGGRTIDFLPPVRSIFRRARELEHEGRALAASIFMVHPWNSDPALGWSTVVYADGDAAAAERFADELAERCWAARHEQPPAFVTPREAIAQARAARWQRRIGVVTISDASDVVTAGAAGDSTHLLRALLEEGDGLLTYASVRDPAAVAALWDAPIGREAAATVGGALDPGSSPPLAVRGVVLGRHTRRGFGRSVTLAIGTVRLVVTEGPTLVFQPRFYKEVGLEPWKADVIVVKNFFPFLLFFAPINRKTIFVRTRGTTDFDAAYALAFDGPIHPRDPVHDWRPRDRARRGV